jgi:glycosyltransferase involved in cell wall biosynthesis
LVTATLLGVETLVFVTQLIDPDDPVLGFVTSQIRVLARRFDVVVIANEVRAVPDDFPVEIVSLGKEGGADRVTRTRRFVRAVNAAMRRQPAGFLAHMCPIYLTLAAPMTRRASVPSMLWFVHPADSPLLRVTEFLADAVITATPGSYPRTGPKVHPIGHAIDTTAITPTPISREPGMPLRLLALGRTSAVKGYETLVRGVAEARRTDVDVVLRIVGPSNTDGERSEREVLEQLAGTLPPGVVTLEAGIGREQVGRIFDDVDVLVNATVSGSADKVVFEAMAAGRPVLVKSRAFDALVEGTALPLMFDDADDSLVECLTQLERAPASTLREIGSSLRERVVNENSLEHWADQVVQVLSEISKTPSSASARRLRQRPQGS